MNPFERGPKRSTPEQDKPGIENESQKSRAEIIRQLIDRLITFNEKTGKYEDNVMRTLYEVLADTIKIPSKGTIGECYKDTTAVYEEILADKMFDDLDKSKWLHLTKEQLNKLIKIIDESGVPLREV